jgi:hypothetical protein
MRTLKQDVLEALQQLPDDADIDQIMYRIYIVDKLRKNKDILEKEQAIWQKGMAYEEG